MDKRNKIVERLIAKIEGYPFSSEGGRLDMCVDWIELKRQIKKLEHYTNILKEIIRYENKVHIGFDKTPRKVKYEIISVWNTIFKDFPDSYGAEEENGTE